MALGTFVTTINCMDGRVQLPVIQYLREKYNVDYVDSITEPGPNRILAEKNDDFTIESIRKRVAISVEKHGSSLISIIGHFDCAGNPVDKKAQLKQLNEAVKTIKSWNSGVDIIKLWVDENWTVQEV
jgi:carbonic anhydrase